ncbi:MAG: winged helix-turn-helix transcriptional regulator [Ignavibacteriales bacterium]|nr:winged helix-turn-helix transcriptional regulator [Ignavibacteriales bacterium]
MTTARRKIDVSSADIRDNCVAVRLRVLTRTVTRLYNDALRPHGLTISQMNILVVVSSVGEIKQQHIGDALHLEKSTLSRDVERMIDHGWLKAMAGYDRRSVLLTMTSAGSTLLKKMVPAWQGAQNRAIVLLGAEGVETLRRAVRNLER